MPIIAVKIDAIHNMQGNLRVSLLKAGLPEYSYKDQRAGFQVWHAERHEGETLIHWQSFATDDAEAEAEQRAGLEACAAHLQEHYWIKLDMPGLYTDVRRPTLRVLYRLTWLS
jgi:hypothetical protein